MQVKIDTKEKFHVITIQERSLTANMTAEIEGSLSTYLQNVVNNVILNLGQVTEMDLTTAESIIKVQQTYYEQSASFVICELQKSVEDFLDQNELLEMMNVTPTQSEAWDIVQMEEIERELLGDED